MNKLLVVCEWPSDKFHIINLWVIVMNEIRTAFRPLYYANWDFDAYSFTVAYRNVVLKYTCEFKQKHDFTQNSTFSITKQLAECCSFHIKIPACIISLLSARDKVSRKSKHAETEFQQYCKVVVASVWWTRTNRHCPDNQSSAFVVSVHGAVLSVCL
jgi:hypothetical protein